MTDDDDRPREVYRDGYVHVQKRMCDSCIFRPGNLMHLNDGRVDGMVTDAGDDGCIPCHEVMDTDQPGVCYGFYSLHRNQVLQIATRMHLVRFQEHVDGDATVPPMRASP